MASIGMNNFNISPEGGRERERRRGRERERRRGREKEREKRQRERLNKLFIFTSHSHKL